MASITEIKNGDGSRSFCAQVRIKPFNPASRTFHERDFPNEPKPRKAASAAAERWAEELEKTLREQKTRGGVRSDVAALTLSKLADEYLADPSVKALATYSERQIQIAWFVNRYGSTKALEFPSPVLLREARDALSAERGVGTTNRYLAAARAMVNFGRASGLLPPNLVWPPKLMLREAANRERFLTDEELGRALKEARAESILMYAATMFAVGVGCRQSEQLRVRWGDIDESNHTVGIRVSKTDTSRRAHMPPAVLDALKEMLGEKVRPLPKRHVFVDAGGTAALKQHVLVDAWERIRKRAGLEDVRWHDLRHACASFLIQNGASLPEVGAQLGHRNVATSARYAHLVKGAKPTGADALNEKLGGGPRR